MKMDRLLIRDIMTTEILFYDKSVENECIKFCEKRDINCLPSLDDSIKTLYRYNKNTRKFVHEKIDDNTTHFLSGGEYIFDKQTLERFKTDHIQFIIYGSELIGIMHFSDYNKPEVSVYLYKLLNDYEQKIRELLKSCGYTNQDMIDFFKMEAERSPEEDSRHYYKKKLDNINTEYLTRFPDFHKFNFKELLELLKHKSEFELNLSVYKLRNSVMHINEFVIRKNQNVDDLNYDLRSFKEFSKLVIKFINDYKKISNYLILKSNP